MSATIINGNNIEELKKFPDNYFDSVVTDPPYGLGKEPNANEMLQAWITDGYLEVKGSGFMGKEWDAFVPQPLFWKEVFRVLKPGGHIVAFFGTRTYDWGVMAMRLAGFEIRDGLQWIYGSGFPKSHNISKAIDKMYGAEREVVGKSNYTMPKADNSIGENSYGISGGKLANGNTAERVVANITEPSTEQAKEWDGWGSALKPAIEPIVLARKPLEKGLSIAENVIKWGTGGINIDECRVGNETLINSYCKKKEGYVSDENGASAGMFSKDGENIANGRFPANIILTHHVECEFKGLKKVKAISGGKGEKSMGGMGKNGIYGEYSLDKLGANAGGIGDENGEETIEDWNCHEDCPIRIMDEQSGESKSSDTKRNRNTIGSFGMPNDNTNEYNDKGGASRFFYTAKASKSERNFGLEGFEEKQTIGGGGLTAELREDGSLETSSAGGKFGSIKAKRTNFHPTVKPVKLMQYLARLITPKNGKVLDPFNGSGTTGIACVLENFEYTGIELNEEYCTIAKARIDAWSEIDEYEQYKKIIEPDKEEQENNYEGKQFKLF